LIFFLLLIHFFLISPFIEENLDINNKIISNKPLNDLPEEVKKLKKLYKEIISYENGHLIFSNKTKLIYTDGKSKNTQELLDNPDIKGMFHWKYNTTLSVPAKDEDAGRVRNELFFKTLYGNTKEEVQKTLGSFVWCPKLVNQTILFNKKNGAFEALKKVSDELDKHPEWKKYITNIGGTFNWRNISGTNRLSAHSFGITIDINTSHSNYWQWDCGCKNENTKLGFKNKIPIEIVKIFEKNGFIWGGRWYHYDTMHFEYRPEMFD
jgi:hypothetical protein